MVYARLVAFYYCLAILARPLNEPSILMEYYDITLYKAIVLLLNCVLWSSVDNFVVFSHITIIKNQYETKQFLVLVTVLNRLLCLPLVEYIVSKIFCKSSFHDWSCSKILRNRSQRFFVVF